MRFRSRSVALRGRGFGGAAVPANALRASDGTPLRTPDGGYILVS